ncbi:MAG TPA: hypothetical protein VGU61_19610, partial [Noviherbaspirillum sp.]|uniref:DUF2917 domain-containing protein n=1 Tax=Noviherbaspirillum sp. TaxID=1926288 RepID=UPI002DDD4E93
MQPVLFANPQSHVEWLLHENHPLSLVRAEGIGIECLSGRALITAFNQLEDVELRPGEIFVVPNQGLVLVEGVATCRVRVRRREGSLRSILGRLRTLQPATSHR